MIESFCVFLHIMNREPHMQNSQGKMAEAMHDQPLLDLRQEGDCCPWVALQLFSPRQLDITARLRDLGLSVFVPMEWTWVEDAQAKPKHVLRPVVRNLLFVKLTHDVADLRAILADQPCPLRLVTVTKDDRRPALIPARQMFEFQAMCNPDILAKVYLSQSEARLKQGARVVVTHGPLKGMQGRLVRASRRYYLLKELPGIAVMMKVTRWCCQPVGDPAATQQQP